MQRRKQKMSDKLESLKINTKSININPARLISGIASLIFGIISVKVAEKRNYNKYRKLINWLCIIFGATCIITEIETDFKPIENEVEEMTDVNE